MPSLFTVGPLLAAFSALATYRTRSRAATDSRAQNARVRPESRLPVHTAIAVYLTLYPVLFDEESVGEEPEDPAVGLKDGGEIS